MDNLFEIRALKLYFGSFYIIMLNFPEIVPRNVHMFGVQGMSYNTHVIIVLDTKRAGVGEGFRAKRVLIHYQVEFHTKILILLTLLPQVSDLK